MAVEKQLNHVGELGDSPGTGTHRPHANMGCLYGDSAGATSVRGISDVKLEVWGAKEAPPTRACANVKDCFVNPPIPTEHELKDMVVFTKSLPGVKFEANGEDAPVVKMRLNHSCAVMTMEDPTAAQGRRDSIVVDEGEELTVIDFNDSEPVERDMVVEPLVGCGWGPRHKLSRIEDMPEYLQFNKYVLTGYRRIHSSWDSALSVVFPCPHNETVNILTHLIPFLFCIFYWPFMYPWDEVAEYPYLTLLGITHVICCVIPLVGSTVYHTFMNCGHGGVTRYQALLRFDMFGIWMTQSFGGLTNVLVSGWCLSPVARNCYLALYMLVSICAFHQSMRANTPMRRRTCFSLCVTVRFVGIGLRVTGYGGGFISTLIPVILQDVVGIAGGVIGASQFPERLYPGRFDYFLNSHNHLHILGVLALVFMNIATNSDVHWLLENLDVPSCKLLI